jgi:Asp-tRNA(Asn)/Glu-tRNA(Gln) amidotransferase A subunit family amidase
LLGNGTDTGNSIRMPAATSSVVGVFPTRGLVSIAGIAPLDGFVYPATQMPPPDETMPQDGKISEGPHSDTAWVNMIGVPAVVVPGGFYPGGLPFGLEISARLWRDGDLLSWAYAYEQSTHHRRPPVLVEKGLLPNAR